MCVRASKSCISLYVQGAPLNSALFENKPKLSDLSVIQYKKNVYRFEVFNLSVIPFEESAPLNALHVGLHFSKKNKSTL